MEDLSSGIMCRLFQAPHAYWKKSWQGEAVRSMADNREAAATSNQMQELLALCSSV